LRLSKKVAAQIRDLDHHGLAKFKDEHGKRLSPRAIAAEVQRRVQEHVKKHPSIRRHREAQASRTLGAR
jgi:hypothetical protein